VGAPSARDWIRRSPKVELHVHLEGAIRPQRLFRIIERHGGEARIRRPADLDFLYQHANFAEFLAHFRFAVLSMRAVEDVHDVALDLFRELVAQNVVYAEVIFSAAVFVRLGMPLGELLAAVSEAEATAVGEAAAGEAAVGSSAPRYNVVVDVVRNFGPEAAERLVEALAREAHPQVVGIHLGGDEVGFPASLFEAAFARAREAGLGCAAHAGEADGPASIRAALDRLAVRRIGHGIRCIEDPQLVHELRARGVTLEVCPTSNVCTGVVANLAAHPLPALVAAQVPVTLGADDPSFFATDLERELWRAHTELGLDLDVIDGFATAGLQAAFLPEAERRMRQAQLDAARAALRAS
jgi:adenosine deaminase